MRLILVLFSSLFFTVNSQAKEVSEAQVFADLVLEVEVEAELVNSILGPEQNQKENRDLLRKFIVEGRFKDNVVSIMDHLEAPEFFKSKSIQEIIFSINKSFNGKRIVSDKVVHDHCDESPATLIFTGLDDQDAPVTLMSFHGNDQTDCHEKANELKVNIKKSVKILSDTKKNKDGRFFYLFPESNELAVSNQSQDESLQNQNTVVSRNKGIQR
jgi:hypothetical protein